MGGLFGGGDAPQVIEPPAPPTRSDAEVRQEAFLERQRRARAMGRAETIKTSPSGVTDEAATASKKLLGE